MNQQTLGTTKTPNIVVIDDGFPPWMRLADRFAALGLGELPQMLDGVAVNPFDLQLDLDQPEADSSPTTAIR